MWTLRQAIQESQWPQVASSAFRPSHRSPAAGGCRGCRWHWRKWDWPGMSSHGICWVLNCSVSFHLGHDFHGWFFLSFRGGFTSLNSVPISLYGWQRFVSYFNPVFSLFFLDGVLGGNDRTEASQKEGFPGRSRYHMVLVSRTRVPPPPLDLFSVCFAWGSVPMGIVSGRFIR